ncbi:hypothetical protein GGR58DRAFT_507072 [Xylaria digitata]|nr:hypothetical protein GGR58DRAFT_507072 [Xylaria digitata]
MASATDKPSLWYDPRPVKGRNKRQIHEWEHEHISLDSYREIRKKPYTEKFDAPLLLILDRWNITLGEISVLEKEDSTVSRYWPCALTSLKHLITRCYDCIWRDHMRFREVFQFSAPRYDIGRDVIDDMGRGVIETDVALSRVATAELICAGFGRWLRDIHKGNGDFAKFSERRASFNFDFVTIDLEWAIIDNKVIHHVPAELPIRLLFPETESSARSLPPNK